MSTVVQPNQAQAMHVELAVSRIKTPMWHDALPELELLLDDVQQTTAPVWPLADYVAVHPYLGWLDYPFTQAHEALKTVSDCELLPQLKQLASQYHAGHFGPQHVAQAVREQSANEADADALAQRLVRMLEAWDTEPLAKADPPNAALRPAAGGGVRASGLPEHVCPLSVDIDARYVTDWTETIKHEVGKFCAGYYDQGQSSWSHPFRTAPLYHAWQQSAEVDLNLEILGLKGFRKCVAELPAEPLPAVAFVLSQLGVPRSLCKEYLTSQVLAMPGWFAWARYRSDSQGGSNARGLSNTGFSDFISLMAIRLAYDWGLSVGLDAKPQWERFHVRLPEPVTDSSASKTSQRLPEVEQRAVLLRAAELAYRERLLGQLQTTRQELPQAAPAVEEPRAGSASNRKLAQMVFCIDVRSERIRRHLESVSDAIESFGFAGFFGVPMAYRSLGAAAASSQLPVLLKPKFEVSEGLHASPEDEAGISVKRRATRLARKVWKQFQSAALTSFAFIESAGWLYAYSLTQRTRQKPMTTNPQDDGQQSGQPYRLGPTLAGLEAQGVDVDQQIGIAQSILKNLGLGNELARLVVFCGHVSQTCNNPLAASLDCGACGGHGGEANARFAALLLNAPHIRRGLQQRGVVIPQDTWFVAAVHNTTTDCIEWFDEALLPAGHQADLQQLKLITGEATQRNRCERALSLQAAAPQAVLNRSSDWSEVRPEWGLAGNAAFIVAPRSMTEGLDLNGRTFLHSYDYTKDSDGSVLELIMTAPMVVAHWINMQYYASTVDPKHFSSGSKTIHNVVGQFGILSGNGGDLGIGLPLESFHNGRTEEHQPLRLLGVIAAPPTMISEVIDKHPLLQQVFTHQWMHLIAVDEGKTFELGGDLSWAAVR